MGNLLIRWPKKMAMWSLAQKSVELPVGQGPFFVDTPKARYQTPRHSQKFASKPCLTMLNNVPRFCPYRASWGKANRFFGSKKKGHPHSQIAPRKQTPEP